MRLKKYPLVLTLIFALLSTSCAAPKKAVSEHHTELNTTQMQTATAESHREDSTATQTERFLTEWLTAWQEKVESGEWRSEIVTEIYDTSQPTDSTTGTPPLLSRTREKREAANRSESRAKSDAEKRDSTATASTATATESANGKMQSANKTTGATRAENHEEKGNNKTLAWVSLALSLLSLAVIAIVIKQRSNNH